MFTLLRLLSETEPFALKPWAWLEFGAAALSIDAVLPLLVGASELL